MLIEPFFTNPSHSIKNSITTRQSEPQIYSHHSQSTGNYEKAHSVPMQKMLISTLGFI